MNFSFEMDNQAYLNLDQEKGNDTIDGGAGDDMILAGRVRDVIYGGDGDDIIDPGARGEDDNLDEVYSGDGNDIFVIGAPKDPDNTSVIEMMKLLRDFNTGLNTNTVEFTLPEEVSEDGLLWEDVATDIGMAIGGEVLGQIPVVGGFLSSISGNVVDWIKASQDKDTSADMIRVMGSNPFEDMLALPMRNTSEIQFRYPQILADGTVETPLEIYYNIDPDDGSSTDAVKIAEIYLADDWLAEVSD